MNQAVSSVSNRQNSVLTLPPHRLEKLSVLDQHLTRRRDRTRLAEAEHRIPMASEEEWPMESHDLLVVCTERKLSFYRANTPVKQGEIDSLSVPERRIHSEQV